MCTNIILFEKEPCSQYPTQMQNLNINFLFLHMASLFTHVKLDLFYPIVQMVNQFLENLE